MQRVVRALLLLVVAGLGAACTTPVARGYYAPVGVDFGRQLEPWRRTLGGLEVDVRCQGVYRNSVGGREVLTTHIQMELTRTGPDEVELPVESLRVDLISAGAEPVSLRPAEIWNGRRRREGSLLVAPWSRAHFDLFFDHPDPELPIPTLVRVRWEQRCHIDGSTWGDCQFQRIADDDRRFPEPLPVTDQAFGMRRGYYLPGPGDLGPRDLRDSIEARPHYLFHDP